MLVHNTLCRPPIWQSVMTDGRACGSDRTDPGIQVWFESVSHLPFRRPQASDLPASDNVTLIHEVDNLKTLTLKRKHTLLSPWTRLPCCRRWVPTQEAGAPRTQGALRSDLHRAARGKTKATENWGVGQPGQGPSEEVSRTLSQWHAQMPLCGFGKDVEG